jgi:hypothetical protein
MIGNEHPTPADFAAAMMGNRGTFMPGAAPQPPPQVYEVPQKNLSGRVIEEVKMPFVVALLFFLFSMPPIRVLAAHYIPSVIKNTGEFTIPGLLGLSGVVGLTFWVLYRVVAPLLSL